MVLPIKIRVARSRAHETKKAAIYCFLNEKELVRTKRTYADMVVIELVDPYAKSTTTQIWSWSPDTRFTEKLALLPGATRLIPELIPDPWGKHTKAERFLLHEDAEKAYQLLQQFFKIIVLP